MGANDGLCSAAMRWVMTMVPGVTMSGDVCMGYGWATMSTIMPGDDGVGVPGGVTTMGDDVRCDGWWSGMTMGAMTVSGYGCGCDDDDNVGAVYGLAGGL